MQQWSWDVTEHDLEKARRFEEKERINPLTSDNMFKGGVYCILSARELYLNQIRRMKRLTFHGVITPEGIKKSPEKVKGILGNGKSKELLEFADWWPESGLAKIITDDLSDGHKKELEIRKRIRKECPGMAYKCASLFMRMCGYRRCIPIDIWMLRFLKSEGREIDLNGYYASKRSPADSKYILYEKWFSEYADKKGIPPAEFQLALWVKNHTAAEGNQMHLFQH